MAINLGCGYRNSFAIRFHIFLHVCMHFIGGKYQAQQQLQMQVQLPHSNNVNGKGQLCVIIRVRVQQAANIDHLRFSTHLNRLWHLQSRRKQQQTAAWSQIKMQFRSSTPWSISDAVSVAFLLARLMTPQCLLVICQFSRQIKRILLPVLSFMAMITWFKGENSSLFWNFLGVIKPACSY